MRRAQALPVAALALTAAALFVSDGSNDDRLFWIGAGVVLTASVAGVAILLRRLAVPTLSPAAGAFC